jgi:hypothetical protein
MPFFHLRYGYWPMRLADRPTFRRTPNWLEVPSTVKAFTRKQTRAVVGLCSLCASQDLGLAWMLAQAIFICLRHRGRSLGLSAFAVAAISSVVPFLADPFDTLKVTVPRLSSPSATGGQKRTACAFRGCCFFAGRDVADVLRPPPRPLCRSLLPPRIGAPSSGCSKFACYGGAYF